MELAAAHRLDILCQKPAANDRGDLTAMMAACESAGVRLMIHENWRFRPWYRAMKTLVESGAIGRPLRIRLAHRDTRALRPGGFADQPYQATMARLILMDMGCHVVDTARYLLGEIESVAATVGRFGTENQGDDVAMLSVTFASGALRARSILAGVLRPIANARGPSRRSTRQRSKARRAPSGF